MKHILVLFSTIALGAAWCAEMPGGEIGKMVDQQIKMVEGEVVGLAEAMPADKYDFAPTGGSFSGVRTFGLQARHIATIVYMVSANVLGEKMPVEMGKDENGADTLNNKAAIVKYLKDSFAYAHKAVAGMTDASAVEMIQPAFGKNKVPRLSMAEVPVWHTFDHYGQMVVYARMNSVVPPASR